MEKKDRSLGEGVNNIPRNPNHKITDEEIDKLLKSATEQVAEKEYKASNSTVGTQRMEGKKKAKEKEEEKRKAAKAKEEEKRKIQETKGKEEERRRAAEIRTREEEKRKTIEARKREEEKRKAQEVKAKEESRRKAAEARNKEEEKRKAAGVKGREEEKRKAQEVKTKEEARRRVAEARTREEERQKAAEFKKKQEEQKKFGDKIKESKEKSVAADIEQPFVVKQSEKNPYKEKLTVGRVIAIFLETVWTIFKVAVLVTIVTVIAGFLLSRDMMIRGRNGNRQCLENMVVAGEVAVNKSAEDKKVAEWLDSVTIEKITLEADDKNILIARKVVVDTNSNQWVVVLHGYNGSMADIYDIAMHYAAEGYNILMPDLRAHGESEGSFLGMGWLDRLDVINWMDIILKENSSAEIVIHGVDVGADTALMISGEPLKSNIKAIVAEGAYTSAWDVVKMEYKARHEKWPVFPFVHMMGPVMKIWTGYTLKEANAVKQIQRTSIPILLIRGQNDTYATEDMTNQLDQAIASEHEVYTVTNGSHEDCRYADKDAYYNKTFEFVSRYVK